MPTIALLLGSAFLFLYIVFSSIEFGAALFLLVPHLLLSRSALRRYLNPVWEMTNIFLICVLVVLFTCFPHASTLFSVALFPIISTALVCFVLRIIGILAIFYQGDERILWRLLFAIGSIGAPLLLSDFYFFLLTGENEPIFPTALSLSITVLTLSTIVLVSSSFFLYFAKEMHGRSRLASTANWSLILWLSGIVLFLGGAATDAPHLLEHPAASMWALLCIPLSALVHRFGMHTKRYLLSFIAAALGAGSMLLFGVLGQLPYLIYPLMTLDAAFTSPIMFHDILISLAIGGPFLLCALVLLYRLFTFIPKNI